MGNALSTLLNNSNILYCIVPTTTICAYFKVDLVKKSFCSLREITKAYCKDFYSYSLWRDDSNPNEAFIKNWEAHGMHCTLRCGLTETRVLENPEEGLGSQNDNEEQGSQNDKDTQTMQDRQEFSGFRNNSKDQEAVNKFFM